MYEGVYWTPKRLFGGAWGVEDAMFCFHAGVVSWLCALAPWGSRVWIYPNVAVALRRLLLVSLFASIGLICLLGLGINTPLAFLLTHSVSTAVILTMRISYTKFVMSGVPLFIVYYFLMLGLWRLLMPGFMDMWTGTELIGIQILGMPLDEYLWVASFCAGFPIAMAFVLDVRMDGKNQSS